MNIALIGYGKMGHMNRVYLQGAWPQHCEYIDVDNQDDFESAAFGVWPT